jgi:hypothetical protein
LVVDVQTIGGNTLAVNLNQWVDIAINNQAWVNRVLHNIGNTGWGRVSLTDYQNHLNYVKQRVDNGQLWVGTISEILTYQIQKLNYIPSSMRNPITGVITVSWNSPAFNVANYLSPLTYKSPITLNVDVTAFPNTYTVWQNGTQITDVTIAGNQYRINIYPHNGPVTLVPGVLSLSDAQQESAYLRYLLESSINIFPNPAKDEVTITLSDENFVLNEIQIYDMDGRIVHAQQAVSGNNVMNISALKKGVYMLKIPVKGMITNKKLVKE